MVSLIIGFLSAIVPQGLKMFQDSKDKKHELALLQLQMESQKQGHTQRLEEINASADIEESKAVYAAYQPLSEYPKTGSVKVDAIGALAVIGMNALNTSVRPVIAYFITGLYGLVKYTTGMTWTPTDTEILFLVLGHFFGNRAMKYVYGGHKNK